jgi:hypothetical protein
MNVTMPPALATYFSAEDSASLDVLEHCFARDAVVRDEGQVVRGLDAIKAWKLDAQAKYRYHVEPISASCEGATTTVIVRLTGSFPGSPIELTYSFGLVGQDCKPGDPLMHLAGSRPMARSAWSQRLQGRTESTLKAPGRSVIRGG